MDTLLGDSIYSGGGCLEAVVLRWLPGGCVCCGGCLEAVCVAVAAWRL